MKKINLGITGCMGRMGQQIIKSVKKNNNFRIVALTESKKLNTDIWYEEGTFLWVKASFDKTGYWEYRLKKVK